MDPKIHTLLKDLQKKFGADVVMTGASLNIGKKLRFRGVKALNKLLGGGVPRAKFTEIYGIEDSGKTTLGYRLLAQVQKEGGTPAYVDAEGQLDRDWAKIQGVDLDNLILIRAVSAEALTEATVQLVRAGIPLVIFDSVAAQEPLRVHEEEMDAGGAPGKIPQLLNRLCRKCLVYFKHSPTALVFINQVREKMMRGRPMYGDFYTTPGGRGIRHFMHLRLEVARIGFNTKHVRTGTKTRTIRTGMKVAVRVTKSKVSVPGKSVELTFKYGEGFVSK